MSDNRKIVILDAVPLNIGDLSWKEIEALGDLTVYDYTSPEQTLERIGDATIIFSNKTVITREIMENSNIQYIGLFSTGYNIIDIEAARERGIIVSNVPDYSTFAVAQFTIALLLELCHKVQKHSDEVHEGKWSNSQYFSYWTYPQIELYNLTIGIVGYGSIGQAVARIAIAMGMKVLIYTRTPKPELEDPYFKFVDFSTLLSKSDVISIHCPLTEKTTNLINKEALSQMQSHAFVINTARGAIVQEADMRDALEQGIIGGYAADVTAVEPIPANSPLLGAKNCLLTPHIAWVAKQTRERLLGVVVDNVTGFLNNRPQNVVTY